MHKYRTTFTPTPMVVKEVRALALKQGKSISEVINDLLETSLKLKTSESVEVKPFRVKAFDLSLRPGVDPTRLRELLSDLEVEEA